MAHVDKRTLPTAVGPPVAAASVLASAVHPCVPAEFLATHWRRRALAVVPSGTPAARAAADARLAPLASELFDLDLRELLASSASERIFAWMHARDAGASAGVERGALRSFELESASAAATAHECGASLYFRAPPAFCEEWVGAACEQLGLGMGARHPTGELRGEVEVFASRAGHTTDWHFDFMENFTFQLRGAKTWRLHGGAGAQIGQPVRGATAHYARAGNLEQQLAVHRLQQPAFALDRDATNALGASAESVTLVAGSVLYFPAGMWHRVECDEDSLSLNLSLIGLTYAELVADAARQLAYAAPALRALVAAPPGARKREQRAVARADCARALDAQRAALDGLRAVDLLPDCAFAPPPPRGYVDVMAETTRRAPASAVADGARRERGRARGEAGRIAGGAGGDAGVGTKRRKRAPESSRVATVACEDGARDDRDAAGAARALVLRLNPLAVLVSDRAALGEVRAKLEEARAEEEEEEEDDDDDDDDDEAQDAGAGQRAARTQGKGAHERHVAASDDDDDDSGANDACGPDGHDDDDDAEPRLFALRVNFGGEDLAPHVRTVLAVPAEAEPLLDWLALVARERCLAAQHAGAAEGPHGCGSRERGRSTCGAPCATLGVAEVAERARSLELDETVARQVLRVLIYHGFAAPLAVD
ncbi:hypothetical protein KFE25_011651 [Diacronema lutheri]|uniref:JmjC domain-containing protein n=1 Tax=Diacronema lutheri TaxID=2081491 RepID=A0A8J6C8S7_DIALT|nr:hypothetical protein KFE25_011651 [Diacronema lutheri]